MARLRANEEAARDVLLVRAIESEDSGALLLTREDRDYASSAALSSSTLSDRAGAKDKTRFLRHRARLALERLTARYPALERVRTYSRWPPWLSWALPMAALVIGLASNAIEGRRFDILALPLLAMIAWNLAVYAWLAISAVLRRGRAKDPAAHPILGALTRFARAGSGRLASHPTLERAVARFASDWWAIAARLTRLRASRTLHISAAFFAVGLLAGLVLRALFTTEYSVAWESTFVGGERFVAAVLGLILGPASALTGIALPSVEQLRELRRAPQNAGDWVVLWTVTVALFVIVPRLVLALVDGTRAAVLGRRLPIDEDFYVRSVLRNALGQARLVRVVPYAFELAAVAGDRLARVLGLAFGEKSQVQADAPVPYGQEDEWLAREGDRLSHADHLVLLFNLGSTPERENHGAFADGVRKHLGRGSELTVLLDESSFARKFRGQPSAQRRIVERLQAWRAVLAPSDLEPITVDLETSDEAGAARALEQAMMKPTGRR